ncbi:MAG: 2-C-methyl-D-erythritol 4-phosphate cytidylyltransferase [Chloroflexota bacterium]
MIRSGRVGAVIAAAGESQRMEGVDKILVPLAGKLILARVIDVFNSSELIDEIVIVLARKNLSLGRSLVKGQSFAKVKGVYLGGRRRQDSVKIGLNKLTECEWVVIHDGARPLVTQELIREGLDAARETGAAVAAVPATDTIKSAGDDMLVRVTPPRHELWAVQTPQVFRFDLIQRAYREVKDEVTDDASLVEKLGYPVKLYPGAYDNIKITTPLDLFLAEALFRRRSEKR